MVVHFSSTPPTQSSTSILVVHTAIHHDFVSMQLLVQFATSSIQYIYKHLQTLTNSTRPQSRNSCRSQTRSNLVGVNQQTCMQGTDNETMNKLSVCPKNQILTNSTIFHQIHTRAPRALNDGCMGTRLAHPEPMLTLLVP